MTYYRLYFLDGSNHIEHFREFEAAGDADALRQSEEWRGLNAMELWSGGRKVACWTRLSPSPEAVARSALQALRLGFSQSGEMMKSRRD